jgi:DNA polymerase III subunit epsilon
MKIGVIDIETSDFFDKGGSILEVGIVIVDTEKKTLNKAFNSLCKEPSFGEKDRDAWVFSNSNLTYDMIDQCKQSFDDIRDEIQAIINVCDYVTAYNKAFDFEFLRDRGVEIANECACLMLEAAQICKIPKPYHWRKNTPDDPYKWPSVNECWKKVFPHIAYDEKHRALDDSIHEGLLCYQMIKEYGVRLIKTKQKA